MDSDGTQFTAIAETASFEKRTVTKITLRPTGSSTPTTPELNLSVYTLRFNCFTRLAWRVSAAIAKGGTLIAFALWVLASTASHAWWASLPQLPMAAWRSCFTASVV